MSLYLSTSRTGTSWLCLACCCSIAFLGIQNMNQKDKARFSISDRINELCVRGLDAKRNNMSRVVRKRFFAYAKTKTLISCAITVHLISAFVFATRIVPTLFYLNPKGQAFRHLLWLYSPVYVGPVFLLFVFIRCVIFLIFERKPGYNGAAL